MREVAYICDDCGSPNILFDAWAVWDCSNQRMAYHSLGDGHLCMDCGATQGYVGKGSSEIIEVDIAKAKGIDI